MLLLIVYFKIEIRKLEINVLFLTNHTFLNYEKVFIV